jgi:hypothetical protein
MDISFYCYRCGQNIVVDGAGAGIAVQCPKCQTELVVPGAQASQSPVQQNKKSLSRIGIFWLAFASLAILCVLLIAHVSTTHTQDTLAVAQTRSDVVKQLDSVLRRFVSLNPVRANFDSVAFDVIPSESGSIVSPYMGWVSYVMPAKVTSWCWNSPPSDSNPDTSDCRVHFSVLFAYQEGRWVFKELRPDKDRAWSECHGCPSFSLTKTSLDIVEQHKEWWQKATAR